MNLLFSFRSQHSLEMTLDKARLKFKPILESKWSDFSKNISGKLNDDGSFEAYPKWSFGSFKIIGVEQDISIVSGVLKQLDDKAVVDYTIRPNHLVLSLFYLSIFIIATEFFKLTNLLGSQYKIGLFFFLILPIFLGTLMRVTTSKLKNRFEKLLHSL